MKEQNDSWDEKATVIQEKIGYTFHNPMILKSAFTHCSYVNEIKSDCPTNERLEFLGDSVLNLITAQHLFKQYPDLEEGDLTKIRSRVVDTKSCCYYTEQLDLSRYMLLGKGERLEIIEDSSKFKRSHINILADLFESIIGAIYLDGGLEKAQIFLLQIIQPAVQRAIENPCDNWKAQLQEFSQKVKKNRPSYETLATTGPDHHRHYVCGVSLGGNLIGKGEGISKKQAQQEAAKEAISLLLKEDNKHEQAKNKLEM